jgi:hypothetical protein
MRKTATLLASIVLVIFPTATIPQDQSASPVPTRRFDGKWQTTVSCEPSRGALGFSYRFVSTVKDGTFHGLRGTEGEPSSLLIAGTISEDGVGHLYAAGKTGSKEFVPGTDTPRGTDFGYHIKAHFDERHAEGTRVEGRPCTIEFDRL